MDKGRFISGFRGSCLNFRPPQGVFFRMSCCPCIVDCYAMFLDQFSANAFVDVVLHGSPLWSAMQNADVVMEKCQTTANSLKLAIEKAERRIHFILT